MAEKALHYDATCHHFRVTVMTRGHALLPKQPSPAQGLSQPKGSCLDPAGFASTWTVFLTNSQPAKLAEKKTCFWFPEQAPLIWKSQRDAASFPGSHLHGVAVGRPRVSLLQEPTSLSAQLGGHRG